MWHQPDKAQSAGRVLDALTSWNGFIAGLSAIIAVCVLAGLGVEHSLGALLRDQQVFSDRQMRNGFVAMSDVQRLLLIAQSASESGFYSADQQDAFRRATDILFTRTENFRRVLDAGETLGSAQDAITELENIVTIADGAIASEFNRPKAILRSLLPAAENTRQALVFFLDDMGRMQSHVLRDQSKAIAEQRSTVFVSLGALALLGLVALMLLRREVLARHARERAERDVAFLAFYDPLTKLPNRTQFQKRLREMLAEPGEVALILGDLDDFKGVNDTYGHAAGDALLRHVAKMIEIAIDDHEGFSARLGGDEFALVLKTTETASLCAICEELLGKAALPMAHEGEFISFGLSLGLATSDHFGTTLGSSAETLNRVADFALYTSKLRGRGHFTIYDEALERRFLTRRAMVEELPRAIRDGDLEIFLQPKVRLDDRTPYGFEALVRWRRDGEIVPPHEFITVAEESGLIVDLDRYVLFRATNVIAEFNRRWGTDFSVSVNLSAVHFSSMKVVDLVHSALKASGIGPELLTIEITETVEMRDWRQAQNIVTHLRALGAKISIDDFGTGYSSLSYLRSTIADEVKIDRSLVENLEASETARLLLAGVFDIARVLKLRVVVEGIETTEQAELLRTMGAKFAQGYFFGRPEPALDALLDAFEGQQERHVLPRPAAL